MIRKCQVCGKEKETFVCGSALGGSSYAYCLDCLKAGAEPWHDLVCFISCAGHYPEDISEAFKEIVRNTCKVLGKTEEEFTKECNIKEEVLK